MSRPPAALRAVSTLLARKGIEIVEATRNRGNHYKVRLRRGQTECLCTMSSSPSDHRAHLNAVAVANRLLREEEETCT